MGIEKDNTRVLVIPPEQISSVTEIRIATNADIIIDTIKDILFNLKEPNLCNSVTDTVHTQRSHLL